VASAVVTDTTVEEPLEMVQPVMRRADAIVQIHYQATTIEDVEDLACAVVRSRVH
jgi:hypothetical protein